MVGQAQSFGSFVRRTIVSLWDVVCRASILRAGACQRITVLSRWQLLDISPEEYSIVRGHRAGVIASGGLGFLRASANADGIRSYRSVGEPHEGMVYCTTGLSGGLR